MVVVALIAGMLMVIHLLPIKKFIPPMGVTGMEAVIANAILMDIFTVMVLLIRVVILTVGENQEAYVVRTVEALIAEMPMVLHLLLIPVTGNILEVTGIWAMIVSVDMMAFIAVAD